MNKHMKTIQAYIQLLLYIYAYMSNGVFDSISAVYMMQHCGVAQEANSIARNIVIAYGYREFVLFKLLITAIIVFIPFMVQLHSKDSARYITWSFLILLGMGGTTATVLNLYAAYCTNPPVSPQLMIFTYLVFGMPLLYIANYFDQRHKNDSYHRLLKNVLNDLSWPPTLKLIFLIGPAAILYHYLS